ncbi:MAG: myo-inositol 2-dehydrogenase [Gammaproteobacteria bacterium]|nr:MAG: myo-inositol 2-dehydrogenase [Gammaproteobacteria bacterium]
MIYVVGAGYMAREYSRVLKALKEQFLVIGRGEESVKKLKSELDIEVYSGGLSPFLLDNKLVPDCAIVCTPVETLASITMELLAFGVKKILIEKPGALSVKELTEIKVLEAEKDATVLIGYNRRFYQATLALEEKLKEEELIAANFEMTEWSHLIEKEPCSDSVKQKWVLANTSHVIDLVMHVTGQFKELSSLTTGSLSWHKSAARFVGSGMSDRGVLISYFGYWDGPGRWSAEFVTTKNRYIFRPMEKLQVQRLGSVTVEFYESVNYKLDEEYKPGVFLQVSAFLSDDYSKLCSLSDQIASFSIYQKIANY